MLRRPAVIIAILFMAFFYSSELRAGYFSDDLEKNIAGRSGDDFMRVLIVPVSDFNSAALKSSLNTAYRTRGERHRAGISELQATADRSQAAAIEWLNEFATAGQARNIKPFWIVNLIEAELTVAALRQMVIEPTIEKIDLYPTIISVPDVVDTRFALSTAALGKNLTAIKADSAWAAGYDGRGRIVCSFDTGVDGLHPALSANYRGNKGHPASECWFSPVDSTVYPKAYTTHGTHTTGIMVGHLVDNSLIIGVAPGADWIAAVAIDVAGSSIFESYQWAVDPDGDPNTVIDVPDVINCSWGIPNIGCADILWQVIDNSEALGIVNIFSAGNEGNGGAFTIRNPANRAEDSLTNFAVGALDTNMTSAWYRSSRGPSDCDSVSIKPNIMAPGTMIYSSVPGGGYVSLTGTSGAAPHISGAVAILRQKNPDATVDEIKTALLNSAVDLGPIGPDNTFGWGRLDIMAALRLIAPASSPSLQVADLPYPEIKPGDAVSLPLALKNVGSAVNNVTASFSNPEGGLTIQTAQITFGRIETGDIVYGNVNLGLLFDPGIATEAYYSLDMLIEGNGYTKSERLSFFVGEMGERTYFHHDTGLVKFTVSNYGAFGFHSGTFTPLGFEGYRLARDTNDLYEGALLIGVDSLHVSDCAKNIVQEPDNDFAVSPGGSITSYSPGLYADQETISHFNDSYAEHPIGLTIQQKSYGWASDPDNTFIILEYIITNGSKIGVNGIRVGLYFDWDIRYYYQNHGSFLPQDDIGYLCWSNGVDSADFRGVEVLNPEGLVNHRIYDSRNETYYSLFTEARKYQGLTDNSSGTMTSLMDVAHITATGPFNLSVQQADTAVFAIIGGADWNQFMACAARARQKYLDLPTDIDDIDQAGLPRSFTLHQNFPNPFNPSTTISLAIPQAGQVRIEIYDILGRIVRTVVDQQLIAGEHAFEWDGASDEGEAVSSGIYFYRVKYDDNSMTRKMVLMK